MPGSLDSSLVRASIADTSGVRLEGKLEREPAGKLAHLRLHALLRLLLRLRDGDEQEVLEHLDVGGIHDARVDLDRLDGPLTVRLHGDHAASRRGLHGLLLQLLLELLEAALHLLRLLQDLHELSHRCATEEERESYPASRAGC